MWPESEETRRLLDEARDGSSKAVNRLLEGHRAALRRMIDLRLDPVLKRRVDASDVVQDVLIEANRRLRDYLRQPAMPFDLWLRHIARDRMIDTHRRHRKAARRSLDRERPLNATADSSTLDLAAQLRDPAMTPAATALVNEMQRRFLEALEVLNQGDREIVLLRHFEQLSNQEAAHALDLSEAAAGMRYLRAMRRLRAHLAGPQPGGEVAP
jgi:RNA polymerase sigma-70 factor (ECF subfamily)